MEFMCSNGYQQKHPLINQWKVTKYIHKQHPHEHTTHTNPTHQQHNTPSIPQPLPTNKTTHPAHHNDKQTKHTRDTGTSPPTDGTHQATHPPATKASTCSNPISKSNIIKQHVTQKQHQRVLKRRQG
jgi:hypothetical protein